jgi:hypothetical protein
VSNFDQIAAAEDCMLAVQGAIEPEVTEPLLPLLSPDGSLTPSSPAVGALSFLTAAFKRPQISF